ncbi:UPF0280 family protein [Chloroflexota bacterium]
MVYEPRTYRWWIEHGDLVSFSVTVKETDLRIEADSDLSEPALEAVNECRGVLEAYIETHPLFGVTLRPVRVEDNMPGLVKGMAVVAGLAGVGPMAAVAGAIAEEVGKKLLNFSNEVIVENGGDIFMRSLRRRVVGIYAGQSPFTGNVAFEVQPESTPLGICCSSGTVGHSLSLGRADAVVSFSSSTALADAAATAIANKVGSAEDIDRAIEFAQGINGITGVAIIKGKSLGLWGKVKLASLEGPEP